MKRAFLILVLASAALGMAAATWWMQSRLNAALVQVEGLEKQVTSLQGNLLGYTRYTSYLTVGKQSLAEQMKLLSATVVREEGTTQIVEKSVLGLPSTGVVAISYTAEYAFGYDLRPDRYELRVTDAGIEIHIDRPALVATPAVSNLRHRIISGGLFTDEKTAIIRLTQEASRRAQQQGEAMASEPAVLALCEKSLTGFLHGFLSRQPGVTQVPRITVVYPPG